MTNAPNHDAGDQQAPPPDPAGGPPAVPPGDHVEAAGLSHPGHVRPNNEDVYIVIQVDRVLRLRDSNMPAGSLRDVEMEIAHGLLVADGIGGMAAGEVASRMAVTTLMQLVLETPDWV